MPLVTIRTDVTDADGGEETISEYLCDCPDCPNIAVHVVGVVRDLNTGLAVCSDHAALLVNSFHNSAHE
ncbi:MAG: hypothetical protein ACRD68_08810 [Pyrinomonadaceae bacterium]